MVLTLFSCFRKLSSLVVALLIENNKLSEHFSKTKKIRMCDLKKNDSINENTSAKLRRSTNY